MAPKRNATALAKSSKRFKATKTKTKSRNSGSYRVPVSRSLVNLGSGFPQRTKISHTYCQSYSTAAVPVGGLTHQFSCNGMWAPTFSYTSHQPFYFDQMNALYNHYTVVKSKMTIMMQGGDGNPVPLAVCLAIDDDGTVPTTQPMFMAEWPNSNYLILPAGTSANPTIRTMYWDAVKYFGPNPTANDGLQGDGTQNPAEQSNYIICFQPIDATAATVDFNYTVIIEYEAIWTETKSVLPS